MNTETPHHGGHEWIHSETIDPHRHIYDEEWVCESGDLQMRIYHSIPCDDGEFWLAEISNGHEPEKGGYRVCGVMVDDFNTARTWCEATLPIAKVMAMYALELRKAQERIRVACEQAGLDVDLVYAQTWQAAYGIGGKRPDRKLGAQRVAHALGAGALSEDEADAVCLADYAERVGRQEELQVRPPYR